MLWCRFYCSRTCCRAKLNQDRVFLHFDEKAKVVIFGVLDGHGDDGHIVSNVNFERECDCSSSDLRFYNTCSLVSFILSFRSML